MAKSKVGAPRNNKNAAGKRVERERIPFSLSLSNGLLDLLSEYVSRQGIEPTDEFLRQFARDWFYQNFGDWLKREIEINDAAIIL